MLKDDDMPHNITPLMLKLKALKDIGYNNEYAVIEGGLKSLDTGKVYSPSEVKIMDHFRDEGISDPEDMSILFSIITNDGKKGTVLAAYGPYADGNLMDFMKQVEDHTIDHI